MDGWMMDGWMDGGPNSKGKGKSSAIRIDSIIDIDTGYAIQPGSSLTRDIE